MQAPGLEIESKPPFSWYLVPSDEIGFKDCPQAFQLTYDGAINNGFGELDLTANGAPLTNRIRTMTDGHLPIYRYSNSRDGAVFDVEVFGAPSRLDPREDLVAYVRIRVSNPTTTSVHAILGAADGPRGQSSRADLGCRPWYAAKFMDAAQFKRNTGAAMTIGIAVKNGHVIYGYSSTPSVDPTHLAVEYSFDLKPGASRTIDLKMPFVPIAVSQKADVLAFRGEGFDSARRQVERFWNGLFARATQIDLPDLKVIDTYKSSLVYDLMARDIEADGSHFTQTVNKFQYHDFYMRDTSFIARSYEMMNLPDVARTTVEHYLLRDASGKVTGLMHNSPDDWGQSLWALGSYLRASGDAAFAKEMWPALKPHLDDFEQAVASDPKGLWPVAGAYDNELINGHYTSHNLWALLGLREAVNICQVAGDSSGAARALGLYKKFNANFQRRLDEITAKDDGYIPPGMDDPNAGFDWENASGGIYPFGVLKPFDPRATATLEMERRYKYQEGIMTWGPNAWVGKQAADSGKPYDPLYLHDYDTFQVTEALLAREEQRQVVEDLYSTLVHTSSTNAGFETGIRPWGNRDPGGNYPPHGWFAARFNELLRNMLIREDGDSLHLASCLAPAWAEPGKQVRILRGLTNFGLVDMTIRFGDDGARVSIDPKWRTAPNHLVFHIPWFVSASSATADGKPGTIRQGQIVLPPSARDLRISWKWTDQPDLSYQRAVELWLQKAYRARPGEDRNHLFPFDDR